MDKTTCTSCGRTFRGKPGTCSGCRTTDRTCSDCGRPFRHHTSLRCNRCRTTDRECATCGKRFRGRDAECYDCKATERPCIVCGRSFHSTKHTCTRCLSGKDSCQMPDCDEPKLHGRGHRYCEKHFAEGPQRERAQMDRRKYEREYGITYEEYLAMLAAQGGACAICKGGNGKRAMNVDHDHATGTVRGLLCDRCNPMLGYARDDIAILQKAIEYLTEFSS